MMTIGENMFGSLLFHRCAVLTMRRRETISSVTVVLRQGRGRPPWQENLQQQNQQQQQQRQVLGNDLTLGCTTMARRRSSWWSLLRTLTRCVTTSSWSTPPATFLQIVVVIVCAINDKRQGRGWNEQFHGLPGDNKDKPTLLPQRFLHSCSQVRSPPLTMNSLPGRQILNHTMNSLSGRQVLN